MIKPITNPRGQLEELLTATQRLWLKVMDGPEMSKDERTMAIVQCCTYFSAAWYLRALSEAAPDKAVEACKHLAEILNDGGGVGEWTWDLLSGMGLDPATIAPAGLGRAEWSWTPPAEPGPNVRRVRPVERYTGDNGIRYDREPDNSGWRLVMMGRPGGVIEWRQVIAGAGSIYGGRQLIDATAELEQTASGKDSTEALPWDDLPEELLNARIQFWACPDGHSDRAPSELLRQTVEWRGDVAHCLEPGCDKTSAAETTEANG